MAVDVVQRYNCLIPPDIVSVAVEEDDSGVEVSMIGSNVVE